jgi:hypothetical protein
LFANLDNKNLLSYEDLKIATFRTIFSCKNVKAKSLKRVINFQNYSNERQDIIHKKDRNPAYNDFYQQMVEYESMKPPPFDLQASILH